MPIWGWVCSGIVLAGVLFLVFALVVDHRMRRHYAAHGEAVIGWIVQANSSLYAPGGIDRPAQILVALDRTIHPTDERMRDLAERVAELKTTDPKGDDEAAVAKLVRDEAYRPFERFRLPDSFCGGREVYSMHVWVARSLLPGKVLSHHFIRCLVLRDDPRSRPLMVEYHPGDDLLRDPD